MNIAILGATGSIGRQTMEVVQNLPNVKVVALAAGSDYEALMNMSKVLKPKLVALYDKNAAAKFNLPGVEVASGMDGILQCVDSADLVINAIVGSIGLKPTLAAVKAKKAVAIANKEPLVAAGSLVMAEGADIRPIDSEHSAIWQCLQPKAQAVKKLILTASGGAFRTWTKEQIKKATAADALRHPNWNMGPKITVDCATMMNKGLEYMEAHWLFNMPYDKIGILVHPQSIIHSMVDFEDGATMAQLAAPDMGQAIQYAITYPNRLSRPHTPIDFTKPLTFEEPDYNRFPCLRLAIEAAKIGGTMPAMMNKLNEYLVAAFLQNQIGFYDISRLIEQAMGEYTIKQIQVLEDVEEAEAWALEFSQKIKL